MPPDPPWDTRREGRTWCPEPVARCEYTPEKLAMIQGTLLGAFSDQT